MASSEKQEMSTVLVFFLAFILGNTILCAYRLRFSPLSRFPGPKIAAVTGWYEFYHDVVRTGRYVFEIEKMHEKYVCYPRIYASGVKQRVNKYAWHQSGFGLNGAHALTESHDLHRMRRRPLGNFFSRKGLERAESAVLDQGRRFSHRLESLRGSQAVLTMDHVFSALVADIIGTLCLEDPLNLLQAEDFAPEWYSSILNATLVATPFAHLPWLVSWVSLLPLRLLLRLAPGAASLRRFHEFSIKHIRSVKAGTYPTVAQDGPMTVIQHLLSSDLPDSEKSSERISQELLVFLIGGNFTTTRALTVTTYYILADPVIEKALREELAGVFLDYPTRMPSWRELEAAEYLKACIKEGLRVSFGPLRHTARCLLDHAIQHGEWTIPPNTPVGMSAYLMHTDPQVYPRPFEFRPERWLPGNNTPLMDRNFVPFSKGSRSCLGMSLAYFEMLLAIALLFRSGAPGLALYETAESDVKPTRGAVMALPSSEARGLRVVID